MMNDGQERWRVLRDERANMRRKDLRRPPGTVTSLYESRLARAGASAFWVIAWVTVVGWSLAGGKGTFPLLAAGLAGMVPCYLLGRLLGRGATVARLRSYYRTTDDVPDDLRRLSRNPASAIAKCAGALERTGLLLPVLAVSLTGPMALVGLFVFTVKSLPWTGRVFDSWFYNHLLGLIPGTVAATVAAGLFAWRIPSIGRQELAAKAVRYALAGVGLAVAASVLVFLPLAWLGIHGMRAFLAVVEAAGLMAVSGAVLYPALLLGVSSMTVTERNDISRCYLDQKRLDLDPAGNVDSDGHDAEAAVRASWNIPAEGPIPEAALGRGSVGRRPSSDQTASL